MDRQRVIDLLDNLVGMIQDNQGNDYDGALRTAIDALKQPEIIRCTDCIKGKYHNLAKSTMCMLHPLNPVRVEPDGFCKWGEKKHVENG